MIQLDDLSPEYFLQFCRSIPVGALVEVGEVEAAVTTARCSRRRPRTNYLHRFRETWTICRAAVAAYWGPAGAQEVGGTDIKRAPNLPILPHLYTAPRQVGAAHSNVLQGPLPVYST
jgi:hypothetical protein